MMDLTAFYSQFRDETVENVRILNEGLLTLDSLDADARRECIDAIFRAMHTIKGSARLLGFEDVGRVAHTCEHILSAVREGQRDLNQALTDDLLRGGDAILELVAAAIDGRASSIDVAMLTMTLGRGARTSVEEAEPQPEPESFPPSLPAPPIAPPPVAEAPPTPQPKAPRAAARQTIRVRVDRLDRLLDLAGELSVSRQTNIAHLQSLDELQMLLEQQERLLLALDTNLKRLRFTPAQREAIERHINGALNIGERAGKLAKAQTERFGQHANLSMHLIEDLEQEVMAARLLPVSTLFANLPRAVRELCRDLGKDAALTLLGETTELDRKVIEALGDPLVHLLRNALDHGIETPDEREAAGKPRQGRIEISARTFGSHAHLILRDDGCGIDPQRVREAAARKNLITAETASVLSDQDAIELIFAPGFSTAQMITDISGRGVGMDVVRTNIMEIGGQVRIESQVGIGTTITLILPLTLVTTRILMIELGEQIFALPASGCLGSAWAYPEQVQTIEGRAVIPYQGRLAPLMRMADLLDVAGANPFPMRHRTPIVLIGTAQRPIALLVDRLVDEREAVIKSLGPLMERQRRYGGAMMLGDGRLVLLVNPTTLAQTTRGMALAAPVARRDIAQRPSRLLVVDDSFTTRELIRSILQAASYEVITAVDGLDALDKLRADAYDLVVSDVEMPRIDGFQLTAQIRKDLGLTELPVVIVTSLASEIHRRRGLEVGAQAYIVKSQFDQSNLLETVRQLLGRDGAGG